MFFLQHVFYQKGKQIVVFLGKIDLGDKLYCTSPPCFHLGPEYLVNKTFPSTPSKPFLRNHLRFVLLKNQQPLNVSNRSRTLCHTSGP